jgi:hypothetical protein
MAGRVSQIALEIDEAGIPAGRLSQVATEIAEAGFPVARISQIALEVAYIAASPIRIIHGLGGWVGPTNG